jgi:hypothetical protein
MPSPLANSSSSPAEVSVVIPTYNRWPLLQRALHAAALQEDVDMEVLVVVDGGTDDTVERLADLDDPRLHVVALDTNRGVAAARNIGAERARGEWLSFLDDDDVWAPSRTRAMVDAGRAAGAGLVMTGTVNIDEHGRVLDVQPPPPDEEIRRRLFGTNVIGGPSAALIRRRAYLDVGGFDPAFNVLADWDLWLRVLAHHPAAAAPGILNGYTVHGEGMHVQHTDAAVEEFERLVARHAASGQADHLRFDRAHFMRWIAETHRRAGRRRQAARQLALNLLRHRGAEDLRRIGSAIAGPRARAQLRRDRRPEELVSPPWLALYGLDAGTARVPAGVIRP